MANYDPFQRYNPITEDNALKVNISRLKSAQYPSDFNAALELLDSIRDVLHIVDKVSRLQELGMIQFYIEALRWLHFETPLTNFVGVPQVTTYSSIDGTIASQFKQYVETYRQQLRTNAVYAAAEVSKVSVQQLQSREAAKDAEKIEADTHESLMQSAAEATQNFREQLSGETNSINQLLEQGSADISRLRSEAQTSLEQEIAAATGRIQAAQALDRWGKTYDDVIEDFKLRLYGPKWGENTVGRNIKSVAAIWSRSFKLNAQPVVAISIFLMFLLVSIIRNTYNLLGYFFRKANSYSGKRALWFGLLSTFAVVFVLMSVLSLTGVSSIGGVHVGKLTTIPNEQWYLKFTVYIPMAIILGLAYSFAIKNFRIYSNMLDQYEHRRTVAYTSQGIILSLKDTGDEVLRGQVTAAASVALFEHKNTGHLSKKEGESMNVLDLININRGL